ncbi:MAG: hypothetical protein QNJ31_01205 [Candidatus Caenarcaniphilales bacterium]|nr:hypothetical protein [Candidatus Caenarcaniphilales bacterium]
MPPSVQERLNQNIGIVGNRQIFGNPSHGEPINDQNILSKLNSTPVPQGWKLLENSKWYSANKSGSGCQVTKDGVTVAHCAKRSFFISGVENNDYKRVHNVDSPVQIRKIGNKHYYRLLTSKVVPKHGEICRATNGSGLRTQLRLEDLQRDTFSSDTGNQMLTINTASPDSMVRVGDYNRKVHNGTSGTEFKCHSGARVVVSTSNVNNKKYGTVSY